MPWSILCIVMINNFRQQLLAILQSWRGMDSYISTLFQLSHLPGCRRECGKSWLALEISGCQPARRDPRNISVVVLGVVLGEGWGGVEGVGGWCWKFWQGGWGQWKEGGAENWLWNQSTLGLVTINILYCYTSCIDRYTFKCSFSHAVCIDSSTAASLF